MIRNAIFAALTLISLNAAAQYKSNVETAAMSCGRIERGETDNKLEELADAKKYIDQAESQPEAAGFPKFWYTKGRVYGLIASDTMVKRVLDKGAAEKSVSALHKYLELDNRRTYEDEAKNILIYSSYYLYVDAYDAIVAKDLNTAERQFNLVIKTINNYDQDKKLKEMNVTENAIINALGQSALQNEDWDKVIQYNESLANRNYNSEMIYVYLEYAYLSKGDTTKAFDAIKRGRDLYPDKKVLIDEEIRLFVMKGQLNELISRFNEVIAADPNVASYYYNRAVVYDNLRGGLAKEIKTYEDSVETLNKKISATAKPDIKSKLTAQRNKVKAQADSLNKLSKDYDVQSEADYKKNIELDPSNADAYYNLGALYMNRTNSLVEQMNATFDEAKYEKLKADYHAKLREIMPYFEKAVSIASSEIESSSDENRKFMLKSDKLTYLRVQQQVYAQLRDMDKMTEMKKQADALEAELNPKK